jgi:hypothetical protein
VCQWEVGQLPTHLRSDVELPRDASGWDLMIEVMIVSEIGCVKQSEQSNRTD